MFKRAKVVMLPTKEKALLWINHLKHGKLNLSEFEMPFNTAQHLYFLSDEEIKEGDWYLTFQNNEVVGELRRCEDSSYSFTNCKKIIATTDKSLSIIKERAGDNVWTQQLPQPSQSFIEKFIEEYNNGNVITKVMVEYETTQTTKKEDYQYFGNHQSNLNYVTQLKINPKDNTITTRILKDNYSREEVEALLHKATLQAAEEGEEFDFWKFIEENL